MNKEQEIQALDCVLEGLAVTIFEIEKDQARDAKLVNSEFLLIDALEKGVTLYIDRRSPELSPDQIELARTFLGRFLKIYYGFAREKFRD